MDIQATNGIGTKYGIQETTVGGSPATGDSFGRLMDERLSTAPDGNQETIHALSVRTSEVDSVNVVLREDLLMPGVKPDVAEPLLRRMDAIEVESRDLNRYVQLYEGGHEFSQTELLALQIRMHELTRSIELLAKSVEHSVGGLKSLLQTNV